MSVCVCVCVKSNWDVCLSGWTEASLSFSPFYPLVQVVRAKERLEEELSIQTSEGKQQNTET